MAKRKTPEVVAASIPDMTITGEPPQGGPVMPSEDGYVRTDGIGGAGAQRATVAPLEAEEVLGCATKAGDAKAAFQDGAYEQFVALIIEETLEKYYGCTSTKDAPPLLNALLKWFREYRELKGDDVKEDDPVLALQKTLAAKRG